VTGFVVDASVVVKWLVSESYSDEAADLLSGEATLVAPALVFAEATNALWALRRRGDIAVDDMADAVHALKSAPIATPVAMSGLAAAAARLAIDLDHPAYDCFYLALAIQTQYPLVTADARFQDKVRRHPYLAESVLHVAHAAGRGGRRLN
jgi:predicted nucleic acid-binding protein